MNFLAVTCRSAHLPVDHRVGGPGAHPHPLLWRPVGPERELPAACSMQHAAHVQSAQQHASVRALCLGTGASNLSLLG